MLGSVDTEHRSTLAQLIQVHVSDGISYSKLNFAQITQIATQMWKQKARKREL